MKVRIYEARDCMGRLWFQVQRWHRSFLWFGKWRTVLLNDIRDDTLRAGLLADAGFIEGTTIPIKQQIEFDTRSKASDIAELIRIDMRLSPNNWK